MKTGTKPKHNTKTVFLVLAAAIAFLVLVGASYLGRSWIRNGLAPSAAKILYSRAVSTDYAGDFSPVNAELKKQGISAVLNRATPRCTVSEYSGFSETIFCSKWTQSDVGILSPSFKTAWKDNSPALEKYLLSHGWTKQWNERQPIHELFNNPDNDVSIGVNYAKARGKISCSLSITYNAAPTSTENKEDFWVNEGCVRSVGFFGGY